MFHKLKQSEALPTKALTESPAPLLLSSLHSGLGHGKGPGLRRPMSAQTPSLSSRYDGLCLLAVFASTRPRHGTASNSS